MSLLGMPARRPAIQMVYAMRPELYDPTDGVGHPTLAVGLDELRRTAMVVTRTSTWDARGPNPVPHPPAPDLGLTLPGWWRLHRIHHVGYMVFNDEADVELVGMLDDRTWERIQSALTGDPRWSGATRGGGS